MLACEGETLNTIKTWLDYKKVTGQKNEYFIHTILLVIICLLLLVVLCISCYLLWNKVLDKKEYTLLYWYKIDSKKGIDIKNQRYCFFIDMITIINIDEKSYKDILVYYTGYVTVKNLSYAKINSVNALYFMIDKFNGYIE